MDKYITVSRKFFADKVKSRAKENRFSAEMVSWRSKHVLHKIARLKRADAQDKLAWLTITGMYTPTRAEISHYLSPRHRLSIFLEDESVLQAGETEDHMEIPS